MSLMQKLDAYLDARDISNVTGSKPDIVEMQKAREELEKEFQKLSDEK